MYYLTQRRTIRPDDQGIAIAERWRPVVIAESVESPAASVSPPDPAARDGASALANLSAKPSRDSLNEL